MNAERWLRRTLGVNAATTAAGAAGALAFAGPLAELLDVPTVAVLAVVAVLADWVLVTGGLARSAPTTLARYAPWVAVGDAGWAVISLTLLASGVVDRSSWWIVLPTSLVVAELAVAQWRLGRTLGDTAPGATLAPA